MTNSEKEQRLEELQELIEVIEKALKDFREKAEEFSNGESYKRIARAINRMMQDIIEVEWHLDDLAIEKQRKRKKLLIKK